MDIQHNFNEERIIEANNIIKQYFKAQEIGIAFKKAPLNLDDFDGLFIFLREEYPIWEKTLNEDELRHFNSLVNSIKNYSYSSQFESNIKTLLNWIKQINSHKKVAYSKSPVGKYINKLSNNEAKGFLYYLTHKPLIEKSHYHDAIHSELVSGVFLGILYDKGFVKKKEIQSILDSPNFIFDQYQKDYEINIERLNEKNKQITEKSDELIEYVEGIENSTENQINELNAKWDSQVNDLIKEKEEIIISLEEQYSEKLKLKGPTQYWADLSSKYQKTGYIWFMITVAMAIIGGFLIWSISKGMDFSNNQNLANSIQKYLLVAVVISIVFFLLNQALKITMSRFHLSSDYKEREQLTMVYLALLGEENNEVSPEEKQIILQSIFSRSDSGLIKGDTGPTLPNNTLSQIMKQIGK